VDPVVSYFTLSKGLVLGNRVIDTRSEWRNFANSDDSKGDPSRVVLYNSFIEFRGLPLIQCWKE
jgi:transcription initiation factor TFIIIB Brf1 subunit/transcription initiation factor TFIIB